MLTLINPLPALRAARLVWPSWPFSDLADLTYIFSLTPGKFFAPKSITGCAYLGILEAFLATIEMTDDRRYQFDLGATPLN